MSPSPEGILGVTLTLFGPLAAAVGLAVAGRTGIGSFIRSRARLVASLDPTPTAWDLAFGRREGSFIRAQLKGGTFVGGYFGSESFASSYPEAQDLFVQQQWWLDDKGQFLKPIAGTSGVLIAREDAISIEFLAATMARR